MIEEKDGLLEVLKIINNKEAYKFVEPKKIDENIFEMGWYDYNPKILELNKIIGTDFDYVKNFKKISNKEIDELSKKDIITYITRIFRGDRFCAGFLAQSIDDGTVGKLLERYLELD